MKIRTKDRVSIALQCNFTKADRRFTGRLENMSTAGLLTVWDAADCAAADLQTGDTWNVEIELPANHSFRPKAFLCKAVIVRIEEHTDEERKVAFGIDSIKAADLRKQAAASSNLPVM